MQINSKNLFTYIQTRTFTKRIKKPETEILIHSAILNPEAQIVSKT